MKVNDKVPVYIAGQTVAQATVRELGDGTATLVVPATLVVMATRTELTVETPVVDDTAPETVITGVDRTSAESEAPVESAVVGDASVVDNSSATSAQPNAAQTVEAPVEVVPAAVAEPVNTEQAPAPETKESAPVETDNA